MRLCCGYIEYLTYWSKCLSAKKWTFGRLCDLFESEITFNKDWIFAVKFETKISPARLLSQLYYMYHWVSSLFAVEINLIMKMRTYSSKILLQVSRCTWSNLQNTCYNAYSQKYTTNISMHMVESTQHLTKYTQLKLHYSYLNAHDQNYATESQRTCSQLFSSF